MKRKRLFTGACMLVLGMCLFVKPDIAKADTEGDFDYVIDTEGDYDEDTGEYKTYDVAKVTGYHGTSVDMVIPEKLGGYIVYSLMYDMDIEENYNMDIESITLPSGMADFTSMDDSNTMSKFEKLNNFYVSSDNVNYAEQDGVLYSKTKDALLQMPPARTGKFTVPEGVIRGNFQYSNITEVYLPSTYIAYFTGEDEAYGCIQDQFNGSKVQKIEVSTDNANCTSYEGMVYDKDLKTLYYCPPMYQGEFKFADTLCEIYGGAFSYNIAENYNIPEGVTELGYNTFYRCENVKSINLPSTVESIAVKTFPANSQFEINFPNGSDRYRVQDGFLIDNSEEKIIFSDYNRRHQSELVIPEGIKEIGDEVFFGAMIQKVVLPQSLEKIDEMAFFFCYILKEVTIPKNVKYIGDMCFYGIDTLKDVYIESDDMEHIGYSFVSDYDYGDNKVNILVKNKYVYDIIMAGDLDKNCVNITLEKQKSPIELNVKEAVIYTGKIQNKCIIKATLNKIEGTVRWKSSNTNVAKVNNGKVTAIKKGTAVITASVAGKTAKVKITVKNPDIKIVDGSESINVIKMKKGKTVYYPIYTNPYKAPVSVSCSSAGKKLVNVSIGKNSGSSMLKVKARKKGTVKLKFKCGGAVKTITVRII